MRKEDGNYYWMEDKLFQGDYAAIASKPELLPVFCRVAWGYRFRDDGESLAQGLVKWGKNYRVFIKMLEYNDNTKPWQECEEVRAGAALCLELIAARRAGGREAIGDKATIPLVRLICNCEQSETREQAEAAFNTIAGGVEELRKIAGDLRELEKYPEISLEERVKLLLKLQNDRKDHAVAAFAAASLLTLGEQTLPILVEQIKCFNEEGAQERYKDIVLRIPLRNAMQSIATLVNDPVDRVVLLGAMCLMEMLEKRITSEDERGEEHLDTKKFPGALKTMLDAAKGIKYVKTAVMNVAKEKYEHFFHGAKELLEEAVRLTGKNMEEVMLSFAPGKLLLFLAKNAEPRIAVNAMGILTNYADELSPKEVRGLIGRQRKILAKTNDLSLAIRILEQNKEYLGRLTLKEIKELVGVLKSRFDPADKRYPQLIGLGTEIYAKAFAAQSARKSVVNMGGEILGETIKQPRGRAFRVETRRVFA